MERRGASARLHIIGRGQSRRCAASETTACGNCGWDGRKPSARLNQRNDLKDARNKDAVGPLHPTSSEQPPRINQLTTLSCIDGGEATAGELPPDALWPVIGPTPAVRQGRPQTNTRSCGIQPAHQSLITDVSRLRLLRCTSIIYAPAIPAVAADSLRGRCLTTDIRASGHTWAGRRRAYCRPCRSFHG